MPDDHKYSVSNPSEDDRRGSQGLPFQPQNDLQAPERKSQSIYSIKEKITKQAGSKQYSNYRPLLDYATAQEGRKRSPSPYSQNFNAQQYTMKSRLDTSQAGRNKEERDQVSSLSKRNNTSFQTSSNYAAPKEHGFKSAFEELRPQVSPFLPTNQNKSQNDGHLSNNRTFGDSGKEIERNNSNKDLFQKHAHNRTTSGLQRDIQALKNMKKQADDVVQRESGNNPYLNQTLKSEESKTGSDWHSEKSDMEHKLLAILQKEIDEKSKELSQKNKEIWDKSKIIIEKNKSIDHMSCEVRDLKRKNDEHSQIMAQKQQEYEQILTFQHK